MLQEIGRESCLGRTSSRTLDGVSNPGSWRAGRRLLGDACDAGTLMPAPDTLLRDANTNTAATISRRGVMPRCTRQPSRQPSRLGMGCGRSGHLAICKTASQSTAGSRGQTHDGIRLTKQEKRQQREIGRRALDAQDGHQVEAPATVLSYPVPCSRMLVRVAPDWCQGGRVGWPR